MYGGELLYAALNISAITSGLDLYNTAPALFNDSLLPADFVGQKSINFYLSAPFDAANDALIYTFIVNCRAQTYGESMTIAQNVINNINRKNFPDYFIICSLQQTISPRDEQDNYNTPVEIILKAR